MRIVSWNCQEGFAKKIDALATLAPDVAVLCEAPLGNPYNGSLFHEPVSWHSKGPLPRKSLAVAGFRGELATRDVVEDEGRWSVAVTDESRLGVLGVWSVPSTGRRCGDEMLAVVDAHADWIAGGNVVVGGDFSIDAHGVGNGHGGAELFATLISRLSALGLVSAYHAWTGETRGPGAGTAP